MLVRISAEELTGEVEKPGPQAEGHDGTGANMDVKNFSKTLFFSCSLFLFSACEKEKTTESVFPNTNQKSGCDSEALIKNKFIVNYEDGRMEVVTSENADVFKKHFLKPKLKEIRHVEFDQVIRLEKPWPLTENLSASASDGTWGPNNINAKSAWDQNINGQGIKVAVVDAAVDYVHPQLKSRLSANLAEINGTLGIDNDGNGYINDYYGWDFYSNHAQPDPFVLPDANEGPNVHGTHVAGIILADHEQGTVQGIAPGAELIPVNFMDRNGGGNLSDAILAIKYSALRNAKIINSSWGGTGCSDTLRDTIWDVSTNGNEGKGILFVAASGNDGVDFDRSSTDYYTYPAAFNLPNQLTVAANDVFDVLVGFSNRSYRLVHLSAPGLEIASTVPHFFSETGIESLSGTSMATPFVSGAAALLWSAKPAATAAQIKQALMSSVDVKSMKVVTQGRLNVQKALDEIRRLVP